MLVCLDLGGPRSPLVLAGVTVTTENGSDLSLWSTVIYLCGRSAAATSPWYGVMGAWEAITSCSEVVMPAKEEVEYARGEDNPGLDAPETNR